MDEQTKEPNSPGPGWIRIVGLLLAFMPSAFALAFFNKDLDGKTFGVFGLVSLVFCLASSFMLFRRGTAWSIVFGVLFLMLNVAITGLSLMFFGCSALLKP